MTIRKLLVAAILASVSGLASAGCDPWELSPGTKISAVYIGELAGIKGRHQCSAKAGYWPYLFRPTWVQARCKVAGTSKRVTVGHTSGYSGTLGFNRNCSIAPGSDSYNFWYVEGTRYKLTGGYYDTQRGIIKARLSNGGVLKIYER